MRDKLKKLLDPAAKVASREKIKQTWRKRRTAYRSGRREVIGTLHNPFKRKTRTVVNKDTSPLAGTDFKSNHRWRRY